MSDGAGYDYQPHRRHRPSPRVPRYAAAVVGVVLAVTGLGWAATRPAQLEHAHPQPAPTLTPGWSGSSAASSPGTAAPSGSAGPGSGGSSGGDGVELDTAPAAATVTVRTFLAGWLARTDPDRRARLLQASATAGLAAELALTDPAAIPAGPVESLALVGASATSVEYRAILPDVTVDVIAAADPQAPHGWYVVSIRQDR